MQNKKYFILFPVPSFYELDFIQGIIRSIWVIKKEEKTKNPIRF